MHIDTCTHFKLCGIIRLTVGHVKSRRKVLKWKNLSPCTESKVRFYKQLEKYDKNFANASGSIQQTEVQ
jgi:hypothetical protein